MVTTSKKDVCPSQSQCLWVQYHGQDIPYKLLCWYIYDHFLFTRLHPQKKPQKKHVDGEWRTKPYLAAPPSAATSETSRSSGSLVDWGCKFYVWTSVPALAPVLHTTARSSKTSVFYYLITLFAIDNFNSWNPKESLKVLHPQPWVLIFSV